MAPLPEIIFAATYLGLIVSKPDDCFDLQNEGNNASILEYEAFKLTVFYAVDSLNPDDSFLFECIKNTVTVTTPKLQNDSKELYLWFLPASLRDSGTYICYLWNASYCVMDIFHIQVLQLSHGQCFHENLLELPETESPPSILIYCPDIDGYFQPLSVLQWFKDCIPITIDNKKYFSNYDKLIISNADDEDTGNYTCKLEYNYLGKKYNVTRTTQLKIEGTINNPIQPEMISPKNETIEAKLGSELNMICEVLLGSGEVEAISRLTWKMNNTDIPEDMVRIKQGNKIDKKEAKHTVVSLRTLSISKIIEEDFQTTFECFAHNPQGNSHGFIKIIPQSTNWKLHVIKVFVLLIFMTLACTAICMTCKVDIVLWYRDVFKSHKYIDDGKIFDAYVIYPRCEDKGSLDNCDANHFALHTLPQALEEKYGYKLFISGRDDLPGQAEVEAIEANIRISRRLIIILAQKPSVNNQAYCGFEQQVGLYNALMQNEIKVILIQLEKDDCLNRFPESIRHIIQKNGTIKWEPDRRGKPERSYSRFWKQVRYKMPLKSKSSTSTVYNS
ncbi:interleukin-1 receptor type 1-like [Stegostoma tigrinum]|uniref:interleukin-1 receptor type 1-like n=1 Tax=Stegostoma tigrinum TaxID=3053191 RepID=UPI002870663D|nr:interleukin-1 receptor type 1-like [Stegostoma tigrinum]